MERLWSSLLALFCPLRCPADGHANREGRGAEGGGEELEGEKTRFVEIYRSEEIYLFKERNLGVKKYIGFKKETKV